MRKYRAEKSTRAEKSREQYSRADQSREEKSNRAEHSAFLTDLTESELFLTKMEKRAPTSSFSIIHSQLSSTVRPYRTNEIPSQLLGE